MSKLEFNSYDLVIREIKGDEFVAFKNAFEDDFIKAMKEQGVIKYVKREVDNGEVQSV